MGLSCFPELASECFREAVEKQQEARPVRFWGQLAPSKAQPRKTRTMARVGRPPRGIGPSDQRAVCNGRPRRSEGADQMSNDRRWQDMTPDEQEVAIRQISGAVNGLQFRVQDLEDAVKALQERLDKRGD